MSPEQVDSSDEVDEDPAVQAAAELLRRIADEEANAQDSRVSQTTWSVQPPDKCTEVIQRFRERYLKLGS